MKTPRPANYKWRAWLLAVLCGAALLVGCGSKSPTASTSTRPSAGGGFKITPINEADPRQAARLAYTVCRVASPAQIKKQFGIHGTSAATIARNYAKAYPATTRRVAERACRKGFGLD